MKKYMILTSVLTLCACGGGTGGGNTAPVRTTSGAPYIVANQQAIDSNSKITGMVSEIDVCHNCTSPRQSPLRASVVDVNGKSFTVYDLNDVDFVMADEGFDGKIQFDVNPNTKEIVGITVDPGEEYAKTFNRNSSNTFGGNITVENDEQALANLRYTSFSKLKNMGLKYSDFGHIYIDKYNEETGNFDTYQKFVFVGGYDTAKRINEIDGEKAFTGYATGSVTAVRNGEGSGKVLKLDTTNNANIADKFATLNFNDGTTTLNAKFDNWYDIQYVKDTDGEHIDFSNYTNSENLTAVDGTVVNANMFKMINDSGDNFTLANNVYHEYENGNPTETELNSLNSDIRYYGDNGNPSEAVGMIQIRDSDNYSGNMDDYDDHHEVRMNLSFGGKVNK